MPYFLNILKVCLQEMDTNTVFHRMRYKFVVINPFTGFRRYIGEPKIALQPDFAGIAAVQIDCTFLTVQIDRRITSFLAFSHSMVVNYLVIIY